MENGREEYGDKLTKGTVIGILDIISTNFLPNFDLATSGLDSNFKYIFHVVLGKHRKFSKTKKFLSEGIAKVLQM